MPERKRNQQLARSMATLVSGLKKTWLPEGSAPGVVEIGIILTEVYYTSNPYVTVNYLASRVTTCSNDTIRRRLEEMVDQGSTEVMEVGGRKMYRARPQAAQGTIDSLIDGLVSVGVDVTKL